jgi:hypothetical protein
VTQEAIGAIRTRAELARRLSDQTKDPAAKGCVLQITPMLEADANRLELDGWETPSERSGMNNFRGREFVLPLLCMIAALLLFLWWP